MSILEHSTTLVVEPPGPGLGTGDGGSKDRDRNTGWGLVAGHEILLGLSVYNLTLRIWNILFSLCFWHLIISKHF